MNRWISTPYRRFAWTAMAFMFASVFMFSLSGRADPAPDQTLSIGDLMTRLIALPALLATAVLALTTAATITPASASTVKSTEQSAQPKPFVAQVVGLEWLNPLQRRDYPTEWQLLWTLGLVKPNKNDYYLKTEPEKFATLQSIGMIAAGGDGEETFKGYHHKYIEALTILFHDRYFSDPNYFYTVHPDDKAKWREAAGLRVEYALPEGKLDPLEAADFVVKRLVRNFEIGPPFPSSLWTRATPPDVRITMGGPNAGFTSLSAALNYLQSHPKESVWAMNWDAPSRPKDDQINENMVLLILAGAEFDTGREPLAWIGHPASRPVSDFEARKGEPPRIVQAWKAVFDAAARNGNRLDTDIGYVIHDASNAHGSTSERIGPLAQALTTELPEFDFVKQSFNTPALLGDMGAGTALTNVALGIAYANHFGKNVLVAGTTHSQQPTAVLVVPPAKVRPIKPDEDWFRARGEGNAFLPWWGLRHDAKPQQQGYSD